MISLTEFLNRAQVNNRSAYNYYPVHSFGRLADRHNEIVTKDVIPYLAKELKQAVKDEDSKKIQVYVRALGNLGHPQILAVFENYLEGKIQVTTFQRLAMVVAMDKLALNYPRLARSVLFKIYQNIGEAHPVRCAAVFQLMRAAPTTLILQRMAEFTNQDTSKHVNSAVKSAIKSAARLTRAENQELAKNAKAAEKFLNEDVDGIQYSRSYLRDYAVSEMNLGLNRQFDYIGSEDDIIPNAVFVATERSIGGLKRFSEYYAMVSSIDDLTKILNDKVDDSKLNRQPEHPRNTRKHWTKENEKQRNLNTKWSTEKIAQMLNIEANDAEQLEGQLMMNFMNTRRFFAFDNQTIERIPSYVQRVAAQLQKGQQFNRTKLYNDDAVTISFPLSTGFPFVFTYRKPTLIKIGGEVRAQTNPSMAQDNKNNKNEIVLPKSVNITTEIEMVYSTVVMGKVGFITPFNHQRYAAGYTKKAQIYLPLRIVADIDLRNNQIVTEIQPLHVKQNPTVFHLSNWPYTSMKFTLPLWGFNSHQNCFSLFTARQDILQLRPVAESKDLKLVHVRAAQNVEQYYGEHSTGFAFRVRIQHEKRFADLAALYQQMKRFDVTNIDMLPMNSLSAEQFEIDVQLDAQRSTTKSAKFSITYEDDVEDNGAEPSDPKHPRSQEVQNNPINAANPSSKSPNSEKRRQEFLRNVAAGITHSKAYVVDVAVEYYGNNKQQNAEYVATVAFADSPINPKTRMLFFASALNAKRSAVPIQICMTANAKWPKTPEMNFKNALEYDATSNVEVIMAHGVGKCQQGSEVKLEAKLKQSEERKQYVRNHPRSKQCYEQMNQGNYQLPACQRSTTEANKLDKVQINIEYQHVPSFVADATQKLYNIARHVGYDYLWEDYNHSGKQGRVEIDANLAVDMRSANVNIQTPNGQSRFNNIRLNKMARLTFGIHPSMSLMQRWNDRNFQSSDVCVVDKNQMNTFDNNTMEHQFGKIWHVMMQTAQLNSADRNSQSDEINQDEQASILIRDIENGKKEVLIVLGQEDGGDYTVRLSPGQDENSTPRMYVNDVEQHPTEKHAYELYSKDDQKQPILRAYAQPRGELKVELRDDTLELTYDGARVKLQADRTYRKNVRGICGTFTGEKETDMKSPKNCILRRPRHFIASWALVDEKSEGPAKNWQSEAREATCVKENILYGNVISESEAGRKRAAKQADKLMTSSSSESDDSSSSSKSSSSTSSSSEESNELKRTMKINKHARMYNNKNECRTLLQTQYARVGDKICFSTRQLPICTKGCKSQDKAPRKVDAFCLHEKEAAAQMYLKNIKEGANPSMYKYKSNAQVSFNLPQECVSAN